MAVFTGGKEKDQYDRRRHGVVLRDQWDRRWETTIDNDSGGPCAPINPKGWHDMLDTPAKFKRVAKDDDGNVSLVIEIDEWIAYAEKAHADYDQKLYGDAMMLFGAEGPKAYEDRTPALINYTGHPPQFVEPLYALKDENDWILGRTTTPDKRLTKFFAKREKVRPSFKNQAQDEDLEIEEAVDPQAVGGKVQKVGPPRPKKPVKALQEA